MRVNTKETLERVPGICKKCNHGITLRTASDRVYTYCRSLQERIRAPVTVCTNFQRSGQDDTFMTSKGWILEVSAKGQIGFLRPGTEEHRKNKYETSFPDE